MSDPIRNKESSVVKPRVAVHKFSSCDGCQLAFINAGEALLTLSGLIDIVHFAEVGPVDPDAKVDIAFVEGSISTPEELERIQAVRNNSKYLITIGACATSGGLQALRNFLCNSPKSGESFQSDLCDVSGCTQSSEQGGESSKTSCCPHAECHGSSCGVDAWISDIYTHPEYIKSLETVTPVSDHVCVDFELWGCPVNPCQVFMVVRDLLSGVKPNLPQDSVCLECKRKGNVCVLVAKGEPCMGPVTKMGCGAICPSLGRACYACFGPSENPNGVSLGQRFKDFGMSSDEIARQFLMINSQSPAFLKAGWHFKSHEDSE